jgi:hypothetical protein
MKRISILLCLLIVCFATAMQAQAPAPKPHAELKKLQVLVGHWTYEGESYAGPWGPAATSRGEYEAQMTLGGFFFQGRWTEKNALAALEIVGYDAVRRSLTNNVWWADGTTLSGTLSVAGNTFTWAGQCVIAAKQYFLKGKVVLTADLTSYTEKFDISADSKTWEPFFEYKYTKAEAAPKK